jgi:hypothetical protein
MHPMSTTPFRPHQRKPADRAMPAAWVGVGMLALLLLTVAVRMADPIGWLGSDDSSYYNAAEHVLAGETIQRIHHHSARSTMVVPIVASISLLGSSKTAVILPTALCSVLGVILVAVLGRLLWGWWEGLLAATVISVLPYYRVLSTVAYPDVHACFWICGAVVLALLAVRRGRGAWAALGWLAAGAAVGIAGSAKIFALITAGTILLIGWLSAGPRLRDRLRAFGLVGAGLVAACAADGLFYLWAADDFWFKVHALQATQSASRFFPHDRYYEAATLGELVRQRLTMLFDPARSGWGWAGAIFWPAALLACVHRNGRVLAFWAATSYLLVAFVPVSFKSGWHPYPQFDGRHALLAAIPFALCLGFAIRWSTRVVRRPIVAQCLLSAAAVVIVLASYARPNDLNGFRYRPTAQLARGIERIIAMEAWDDREVFMSPSMYKRYHILFPATLRERLRVATDARARDWWRYAAVNIEARQKPLPKPGHAYLLVTPRQLRGEAEFWDYGVPLPAVDLVAWQSVPPSIQLSRLPDKSVTAVPPGAPRGKPLLILLSGMSNRARLTGRNGPADR